MSTGLALLIGLWLAPAEAAAGEPPPIQRPSRVRLDWRAPVGCPDAAAVRERLRERVPDLEAPLGAGAQQLEARARIAAQGSGFRAELWLSSHAGTDAREFRAGDCAVLADAVALVIAVSLDPVAAAAGVSLDSVAAIGRLEDEAGEAAVGQAADTAVRQAPDAAGETVDGERAGSEELGDAGAREQSVGDGQGAGARASSKQAGSEQAGPAQLGDAGSEPRTDRERVGSAAMSAGREGPTVSSRVADAAAPRLADASTRSRSAAGSGGRNVAGRLRVGLRLQGGGGFGPTNTGTGTLGGSVALFGPRWRAQVDARWILPRIVTTQELAGAFDAWLVGAAGCFVPTVRVIELPLCAGVEAGQLRGEGRSLPTVSAARFAHVALRVGQGIAWAPIDRLALGLDLELSAPLTRAAFVVDGTTVQRTAAVGVRALVGLELRLPRVPANGR